jgi:transposase
MTKTVKPKTETEAQKLVGRLLKLGLKYEEIAFRLRVSLNSVIRWKRGVTPHPGHLTSLKELATGMKKK